MYQSRFFPGSCSCQSAKDFWFTLLNEVLSTKKRARLNNLQVETRPPNEEEPSGRARTEERGRTQTRRDVAKWVSKWVKTLVFSVG